jgi:uncharacterized protein YpiB (UPF0302 family)
MYSKLLQQYCSNGFFQNTFCIVFLGSNSPDDLLRKLMKNSCNLKNLTFVDMTDGCSRTPNYSNIKIDFDWLFFSNYNSVLQSINQSLSQSVNHSFIQSINQSINQSVNQSINQSIDQSINRLVRNMTKFENMVVLLS